MTTRRNLFAAALLLVGAVLWTSCQKEAGSVRDEAPADIPEGSLWLSLEASKGADTKALELVGSTLNAYWVQDEPVKVFLNGTCIGTLKATPNGTDPTKATLSGTVSDASGIAENAVLTLLFPRDEWSYANQTGTLDAIAANYDYAAAEVEVISVDGTYVTTTQASFVNRQSIYKLTFTGLLVEGITSVTIHSAGNKLVASSEVGGSQTYGDITVTLDDDTRSANGEGVVYAALRFDALEAGQTDELTITVTDTGSNTYVATKTSPSGGFINGKYYTSTIGDYVQRRINLGSVTGTDGNGQKYFAAQDGDTITGRFLENGSWDYGYITIPDGDTVTLDDAEIDAPNGDHAAIHCLGSAHIILEGSNGALPSGDGYPAVLAAHNGSGEEYTLTISGTGSLDANSQNAGGSAGIGGGFEIPCGNIVIEGGYIRAKGGAGAAGIGSGAESSCGNITISGDEVRAYGGRDDNPDPQWCAAGIGSGFNSSCGDITISGGSVWAYGGWNEVSQQQLNAAGIGSGCAMDGGTSECGDITIYGGEMIGAYGGTNAAGIGSGCAMNDGTSKCGDITISGGRIGFYVPGLGLVDGGAIGGDNAAGIGSGCAMGSGTNKCGNITITDGIIYLYAQKGSTNSDDYCIIGYGYGYGGSYGEFGEEDSCGTVTIAGEVMDGDRMKYGVDGTTIGSLNSRASGCVWELSYPPFN